MSAHAWNGNAFAKIRQRAYWTGSAWQTIKSSHIWTGTAWQTIYASFAPSKMKKSGTQSVNTDAFSQLVGWTPDPAVTGSAIVDNALIANGSKVVNVVAFVDYTGGGYGNTTTVELRKNGAMIATNFFKSHGAGTVTVTAPNHAVSGGDAFTVWVKRAYFGITVTALSNVSIG